MHQTESEIIHSIEMRVGQRVPHVLVDGRCLELSLASELDLFHGLIRNHTPDQKLEILRLVARLTGLRKLDLRRNRLIQMPPEFDRLFELEHLNLGSNYLGRVPAFLQSCRNLRYLHLGNNDLTELPQFLGGFPKLEYLTLHKNIKLKSIQPLRGLTSLRSLNLYFLNLHELPDFVLTFKKLTTLTLWNIRHFAGGLEQLPNLEFFSLCGGVGLKELPAGLTQLRSLRMLRLFQNGLERLPEDFGQLSRLEQVSLYQNHLSCLPDSMRNLVQLQKLNLGWNRFESLPDWIQELPRLEWLAVFENPLRQPFPIRAGSAVCVASEWPFSTLPKEEPSQGG